MKFYGFLLLWSLLSWGLDANPGIKLKITLTGLDCGKQFGIEFLQQQLKEAIFEDIRGQESTGLGKLDYTVSRLKVINIDFPNTSVTLIPGFGINLLFEDATAAVTADWKIKSWMFTRSGSVSINISRVLISAIAVVSRDDDTGHPSLQFASCQANIRVLNIKMDGQTSWFIKLFSGYLEKSIRNVLNGNLCQYISDEIQRINTKFREYPVLTQIDNFAQIDNTMVKSPTIFETHINLDLKGTIYPADKISEPPFEAASFVLPDINHSMLYIGLSEYFFQSASVAYYTSGAFNVSTGEKLSSYFNFTTDTFGSIIPTIAERYAEPYPVMMNLLATAAPVITLHRGRFNLEFIGSMEVLAVLPNSTAQSLFILKITADTHTSLTIFEDELIPTICLDSFQLSLANSNVGIFRVSLLENLLTYVLQNGVIPAVNAKLKDGFPLPYMDKLSLVEPAVKIHKGYLLISTDISFDHKAREHLESSERL
ncbi:BPI fold-containing family C protein [Hemicordylus capensis]|uniref:BPI fold-containing family C protein n=1 Tax=Hemicordylus capensis TaxID=884348 RepID=UPI0023044A85|nr:BPI fold-containing family C protein [Hemicordylus capensis]